MSRPDTKMANLEGDEIFHDRGPVEIEAKFAVLDTNTARWILRARVIAGLMASAARSPNTFEDRYLDTRDSTLRRQGWTLRLRKLSRGTLASLKSINLAKGSVHTRDEIECLAKQETDPFKWPKSEVRERVLRLLEGQTLMEVATVRQHRQLLLGIARMARQYGAPVALQTHWWATLFLGHPV